MVPTTDVLTSTRDRESGALYADLAGSDEFLGSHVLRVPSGGSSSPMVGSRENRGKARQYTTFNGRIVVVKDSWVYSNKGMFYLAGFFLGLQLSAGRWVVVGAVVDSRG